MPSSTTPSSTPARIRGDQETKAAGPLVVSYVHGHRANPIEDRFDYVFISDEIGVTECSYAYQGARVACSDHGIVTAELQLC
jgi:endonuclease/exonuclease/phosphatase family metal-dependent hydrolase